MNPHTSGCIRRVWVRKMPRSSGIVSSLAEQMLEHRRARALGVDALRYLGELERVAEQDQRLRRRAAWRPRRRAEICPASSITSVSIADRVADREKKNDGAGDQRAPRAAGSRRRPPLLDAIALVLAAALAAPERLAPLLHRGPRLLEEVVDHLVALRGDADLPSLASRLVIAARPGRSCPTPAAPARTGTSRSSRACERCCSPRSAAAPGRRRAAGRAARAAAVRGSASSSSRTDAPKRASAACCMFGGKVRRARRRPATRSSFALLRFIREGARRRCRRRSRSRRTCVAGSSTVRPRSIWCCWAGNVNSHSSDLPTTTGD